MAYLQSPNCQSHSPEVCPRALQLRAQAVDPPNHLVPELQRNPAFAWVILSKIIANDERMRLFEAPFSVLLVSSNSLFIYQDENENQSFRSFLYVLKQTCDEQTNNYM